jgi:hypothetical protein
MEPAYKSLKTKVDALIEEIKNISSNYSVKKLNIDIVLHNKKTDKDVHFTLDESKNFSVSVGDSETSDEEINTSLVKSDDTLSTRIFNTTVGAEETETSRTDVASSELQTTETDKDDKRTSGKEAVGGLRGGFKKSTSNKYFSANQMNFSATSNDSATSALNTDIKNVFNKQSGGNYLLSATSANLVNSATSMSATSDYKVGGNKVEYSATSMSPTSDYKVGGNKVEYSATSMSPTSDYKVGGNKFGVNNAEYSATSMSATSDYKVGGNKVEYSATSMSATSDYKVGGGKVEYSATSMSATSDYKVGGGKVEYSATSDLNSNMQGGFNKNLSRSKKNTSSKMDLIRQKIRELETVSENEVFRKNVSQMGGSNKQKFNEIKQAIGFNSSSTSSLCE